MVRYLPFLRVHDGSSCHAARNRRGGRAMTQFKAARIAAVASVFLIGLTLLSTTLAAQTTKVEGLIKGRNGDRIILKTIDAPNLVIVLTDSTEVGQVQGVLKARRKEMSMAALIPGLAIKAE